MKKIGILGSTGSIGTQTLDVVRANAGEFEIVSLAAGSNIDLLEKQILEFTPKMAAVWEEEKAMELKRRLVGKDIKIYSGMEGLLACSTAKEAELIVGAVVGMIGILPTIEAIRSGKEIALANKETLVTAGHLIMPLVKERNTALLPVDSEHSAIFQSMNGELQKEVDKIILTASGGPFRGKTKEFLQNVTVADALKHPNWSMGKKITIDSSTMINKGLEVMEAKWLFNVEIEQIEVIIQPQSVIHSMVQYKDGAVMAQLGTPDMKLPIQYALFYPHRRHLAGERLDFARLGGITFERPDLNTFSGLKLAYQVGKQGGSAPTIYNAANEKAVALFLNHKIRYPEITEIMEYALSKVKIRKHPNLEEILMTEAETYEVIDSKWR